jgi:hypothetical protein
MTSLINRVLRKLHVINPLFDEDDMINASIEDKAKEHESVVRRLATTLSRREILNGELRESIKLAREATNSFADFERLTIRRKEQGQ